jgi:hypothetical protein
LVTTISGWEIQYITAVSSLSYDGLTFMTTHWDLTVNGDINAGMTKIYSYNSSSNSWIQKGQDITYEEITLIAEARLLQYGSDAKCLSLDGSTIIIGTRVRPNVIYNVNANLGTVQAYRYSNITNYWSKIGRVMTGTGRCGQYARSNYNGNVIMLDDDSFQETTTSVFNSGRIRVFEIEI